MARTSKKKPADHGISADKKSGKIYSAGIYARLSVDTDERKNESIETQVEIAKEFIRQQGDMDLYDCYTDMGKTGTNFEREGFERMMQDVRMRKIDCIVVKDLSR
ncbi:MAG: recombinase family protein, partial [Lachnospiraceae bacterium]|nr:recombinase family protein [Lachnospiraceae bacterium]